MYVRYQHVRNAAILMGIASTIAYCSTREAPPPRPKPVVPQATAPVAPARRAAARDEQKAAPSASVDQRIVALASMPAGPHSKQKDAFRGSGPKVNLYEDNGDQQYDRVKVDLQRDGTWDESWTFKQGRWEKAGGALVWNGAAFVSPAAAAAAAAPSAAAPAAAAPAASAPVASSDPLVALAQRMLSERATGPKLKDALRGRGPKVNLYDDNGDGRWDRAKVDHERDETWDEKWTLKDGRLERKVESSGKVSVFEGGAWVAK